MRILKVTAKIILALIALLVVGLGAIWIFNPFAPPVEVSAPGPHGERINEGDLIANFYAVDGLGTYPAILLLGGSEGGIGTTHIAEALQSQNYAVLTLSYFGGPGQPRNLELVPLELFDQAINWLKVQPNIDKNKLAVMGVSKGAEAALIIATRRPEIRAVVAALPSSVAWQGIDSNLLKQIATPPDGSWSLSGEPIPFIPYVEEYVRGPLELYVKSLAHASKQPDAIIPIEESGAAILLICGEDDTLWPSCDMARQIAARATERDGPDVTLLAYDNAGHAVFGLPIDPSHPNFDRLASMGARLRVIMRRVLMGGRKRWTICKLYSCRRLSNLKGGSKPRARPNARALSIEYIMKALVFLI